MMRSHFKAWDERVSAEVEWWRVEANPETVIRNRKREWADYSGELAERRPKYSNVPHPLSAFAKLPMRATKALPSAPMPKGNAARLTGRAFAPKPVIFRTAPHALSYRPDLPLGHKAVSLTLTKAERATLASRPLRYTRRAD
jgi:hypothetical protein